MADGLTLPAPAGLPYHEDNEPLADIGQSTRLMMEAVDDRPRGRVYGHTLPAVTPGSTVTVPFTTAAEMGPGCSLDPATGEVTVPPGLYWFQASVSVDGPGAVSHGHGRVNIQRAGASVAGAWFATAGVTNVSQSVGQLVRVAEGQPLRMVVHVSGSVSTSMNVFQSADETYMAFHWVGA